ncbi:replication protein A 70 kDa DNA-binding subunit [Striga asiatica]|uniref:Replication protein A 70 kDa DNA-binding subunit n=1 Tax=Striga asiatica TaxID=4170 RepID=A0A5A7QD40_STRAF|nr:replication protein A 70 kDa DNA-binding subunit [Striga asiatica]
MAFTLLKNVNMDKTEWNIKVRVVRCYERTTFGDRSTVLGLEVILHDSEGYRIHASVKKFHMELFRRHLKEGSVLAIRDFIVAPNGGRYKTTIGRFKIAFHGRTRVVRVSEDRFTKFLYNFTNFSELAKGTFFDPMLIGESPKTGTNEHRVEKGSFSQLRKVREIVEEFWKPVFGDSHHPSAAMKSNFEPSYCCLIPTTVWSYNEVPDSKNDSFLQMAPKKIYMKLLDRSMNTNHEVLLQDPKL